MYLSKITLVYVKEIIKETQIPLYQLYITTIILLYSKYYIAQIYYYFVLLKYIPTTKRSDINLSQNSDEYCCVVYYNIT